MIAPEIVSIIFLNKFVRLRMCGMRFAKKGHGSNKKRYPPDPGFYSRDNKQYLKFLLIEGIKVKNKTKKIK